MPGGHLVNATLSDRPLVLLAILLASLSANVWLGLAWRQQAAVVPTGPPRIYKPPAVGTRVPSLDLRSLDGRTVNIRTIGKPTLVYSMSPTCQWCMRNTPSIKALANSLKAKFTLVGVSKQRDGLEDYLKMADPGFEVFTNLDESTLRAFSDLAVTPQTILISGEGVITNVWTGAYQGDDKDDIERVFGVTLPSLEPLQMSSAQCEDRNGDVQGKGVVIWTPKGLVRCDGYNKWVPVTM
jgi:hypothetical protein